MFTNKAKGGGNGKGREEKGGGRWEGKGERRGPNSFLT